jgi:hypothetical protein
VRFEWDGANEDHILRHRVDTDEAEDVFEDHHRVVQPTRKAGEPRFVVTGQTRDGRLLAVVYTRRRSTIRVITARDANEAERRRYRRRSQ